MGQILRYNDFLLTYKTRGYRLKHLEEWKKFFPIKASPEISGVVGDIFCDGHLQANPKWRIDFTSKDLGELKRFNNSFYNIFKIKGKVRECKYNSFSKSYNLGINCAVVSRILFLLGVPTGEKVLRLFDVPAWIKQDKECFKLFCRRCFTCEGTIMHDGRKIPQIRMEFWKQKDLIKKDKFVKNIAKCLEYHFSIDSSIGYPNSRCIRRDKIITRPIKLYLMGKNVIKFYSQVGFEGLKQKSLKAHIAGYI
ncbi:MAG: hypothetical protein ACP5D2_05300 [Candidatus Nanoarchaeia archaeon]